jgi:hypothetical protein
MASEGNYIFALLLAKNFEKPIEYKCTWTGPLSASHTARYRGHFRDPRKGRGTWLKLRKKRKIN